MMMRKVEQQMVHAIENRKSVKVHNDEVTQWDSVAEWRLHGHLIAEYDYQTGRLILHDAGWRTVTTKSRLNAAAQGLGWKRFKLWQENHEWFWTLNDGMLNGWSGSTLLFGTDKT